MSYMEGQSYILLGPFKLNKLLLLCIFMKEIKTMSINVILVSLLLTLSRYLPSSKKQPKILKKVILKTCLNFTNNLVGKYLFKFNNKDSRITSIGIVLP